MAVPNREKRVVAIAVDPSEYADYAFEWYVQYLHHPTNEVVAIHVPEGFDVTKAQKELAKGGQMKESLEKQYSKITELEERYRHKMQDNKIKGTVLSVPSKNAGLTIIETAREEKAFAIIMGTRGRSKIKKVMMGSVSDCVMKNADIPVIIVRRNPREEAL